MKHTLFAALGASLILSCTPEPEPEPEPEPAITQPPAAPSHEDTPTPPAPEISDRTNDLVVPSDVTLTVRRETEHRFAVRVKRKGHLVSLHQGAAHATGDGEAEIPFAVSTARDLPITWEATDPTTLVTARGLVELDTEGAARLLPTPAPRVTASETRRRHACRAHEDASGGFTVICRVEGFASAVRLTGSDPRDGVWMTSNATRTLVRAELTAHPGGVDVIALGYADGATGVVLRAEATRAAGEPRPSIVIQSAERAQPVPSRTRFPKFELVEF